MDSGRLFFLSRFERVFGVQAKSEIHELLLSPSKTINHADPSPTHHSSFTAIQSCWQTELQGAITATHSIMDGKIAVSSSHLPLLAVLIIFGLENCQHDLLANHHVSQLPSAGRHLLS